MKTDAVSRKTIICLIISGIALAMLVVLSLTLAAVQISRYGTDGYYKAFGKAVVVADDDLMSGNEDGSFGYGEAVSFKLLDNSEKTSLVRGEVVLFVKDGTAIARRISQKVKDGVATYYLVQTDADDGDKPEVVSPDKVIGVYAYQSASSGAFLSFTDTISGYIVCFLLPTVLVAAYVTVLFRVLR